MKQFFAIIIAVLTFATAASVARAEEKQPQQVTFPVQNQDFAVNISWPKRVDGSLTHNTVTGPHVTVQHTDAWELKSVQSNWDGHSEKGRHVYTMYFNLKGCTNPLLLVRTINLEDFTTVYTASDKVPVAAKMKVDMEGVNLSFQSLKWDHFDGFNPTKLAFK